MKVGRGDDLPDLRAAPAVSESPENINHPAAFLTGAGHSPRKGPWFFFTIQKTSITNKKNHITPNIQQSRFFFLLPRWDSMLLRSSFLGTCPLRRGTAAGVAGPGKGPPGPTTRPSRRHGSRKRIFASKKTPCPRCTLLFVVLHEHQTYPPSFHCPIDRPSARGGEPGRSPVNGKPGTPAVRIQPPAPTQKPML